MHDRHHEIVAMEEEIEALAERAEQCRKLSVLAKGMIAVGPVLLLLALLGHFGRAPALVGLGFAALLGGIVVHGSNRSTLDGLRAQIAERESSRAGLIDAIAFSRDAGSTDGRST